MGFQPGGLKRDVVAYRKRKIVTLRNNWETCTFERGNKIFPQAEENIAIGKTSIYKRGGDEGPKR